MVVGAKVWLLSGDERQNRRQRQEGSSFQKCTWSCIGNAIWKKTNQQRLVTSRAATGRRGFAFHFALYNITSRFGELCSFGNETARWSRGYAYAAWFKRPTASYTGRSSGTKAKCASIVKPLGQHVVCPITQDILDLYAGETLSVASWQQNIAVIIIQAQQNVL